MYYSLFLHTFGLSCPYHSDIGSTSDQQPNGHTLDQYVTEIYFVRNVFYLHLIHIHVHIIR